MKIRTLLGLTVLGSAAYAHRRNGGEFTIESMKKSWNDLWSGIRSKATDVKARAEQLTDKRPDRMKGAGSSARAGAAYEPTSVAGGATTALGATPGKPSEPLSPGRSATDDRFGTNGPGGIGRGR